MFRSVLLSLTGLLACQSVVADEVFFRTEVEASAEPVPIYDMIHGWDGAVEPGEYAFGDASISAGVKYHGFVLGVEKRWFYSMQFTPETVAWYLELDRGIETTVASDILLDVQSFDGRGITGGYEFSGNRWSLTPLFTIYKIGHYQFGETDGVTSPGEGIDASVYLEYYFDEDKILDYRAEEGDRFGYSFTLQGRWSHPSGLDFAFELRDLWNLLEFYQASYREGCVNFGTVDENICNFGDSSAEGQDGNQNFNASIPVTVIASLDYRPFLLSAGIYRHDHYQRLTLGKGWMVRDDVRLDALATNLNQLGVRVRRGNLSFTYLADDLRFKEARDARLDFSYAYPF